MAGELFHTDGSRKYLTLEERAAFLEASRRFPRDVETFCHVLAYGGCRLAEALALTADRVDLKAHSLTFETLKKRKRGVYRVPGDGLAQGESRHGRCRHYRLPCQSQGPAAWFRRCRRTGKHPAESRTALAGTCPAFYYSDLRRGHGEGRTRYCRAYVVMRSEGDYEHTSN